MGNTTPGNRVTCVIEKGLPIEEEKRWRKAGRSFGKDDRLHIKLGDIVEENRSADAEC